MQIKRVDFEKKDQNIDYHSAKHTDNLRWLQNFYAHNKVDLIE